MPELKNKVVIITGASEGIGKDAAILFAQKGAKVVLVARTLKNLEKVGVELEKINADFLILQADVSKSAQVEKLVADTVNKFEKIDILVNNAGVGGRYGSFLNISEQEYDDVMDINMKGVFLCCKAAVPKMIKQKSGQIINVSSIVGLRTAPNYSVYSASKFALVGFSRALSADLGKKGITVNLVCPGLTQTNFVKKLKFDSMIINNPVAKKYISRRGMPSVQVAEEIVKLALAPENGKEIVLG